MTLERNSTRAFDAKAPDGTKYQIKARLVSAFNPSRQLSDVRHLDERRPFDFLIAVIFGTNSPEVDAAYKIPLSVVRQFVKKKGTRDVLIARGPALTATGVEDITSKLRP